MSTSMSRPSCLTMICTMAILSTLTGCTQSIEVCIDNGSTELITVVINREHQIEVPAGEHAFVQCEPGETSFSVRRGERIMLSTKYTLEYKPGGGSTRVYLFNPDRSRAYVRADVEYGTTVASGFLNMVKSSEQMSKEKQNSLTYHSMADDVSVLPMTGWNDITGTRYILKKLPQSASSRSTGTMISTVQSVSRDDYRRLASVLNRKKPTEEDCEQLSDAMDEVFSKL